MKNDQLLQLNFDGWPLPDSHLIELGRVGALWATLESFLNLCIGKLAGFNDLDDPKAFILVTHASFPQRLDMLAALCEQLVRQYPKLKGYAAIVQQLRQAQKRRNDFMHYGMVLNTDSGHVEMAKGTARGTVKVGVEKVTVADLRRASVAIHEAQLALYKLFLAVRSNPFGRENDAEPLVSADGLRPTLNSNVRHLPRRSHLVEGGAIMDTGAERQGLQWQVGVCDRISQLYLQDRARRTSACT